MIDINWKVLTNKTVKIKEIITGPFSGEWGDGVGGYNVIRTTNFNNDGSLNLAEVVKRNISDKKVAQKSLVFGDTIIEKSGGSPNQPVGRVVYFDVKNDIFLCNNFTSVIRPTSKVDSKYLFWFLFSNHLSGKTLKYQNKTTGIINLQLDRYLNEIEIPLPPLHTQKRIADILDKADALQRKDQELLEKYDELAQAIFIDLFGDPVKNEKGWQLRPFGERILSIRYGTGSPPIYSEEGIPFIRATNIKKGVIVRKDMVYVSSEESKKIAKCFVNKGDLIIVRSGVNTGDCGIITQEYDKSLAGYDLIIEIDSDISPFYHFLINSIWGQRMIKLLSRRAAQPHLNAEQVKALLFIAPPDEIMKKFGKALNLISSSLITIGKTNDYNSALYKSLLQQTFRGELN